MVEEKYLIMVDSLDNHNKFYRMIPLPNGNFRVEYGRVGANDQTREYDQKLSTHPVCSLCVMYLV